MKFTLRPWKLSDLESLVKHANNYELAKNLADKFPSPYTKADGKSYLQFATNAEPALLLAIDVNDVAVGSLGLFPQDDVHRKNAELGYWLAEDFWGKGIVTNAIIDIVKMGFAKFDINRIFARPFGSNIGSQRVLEKAGFTLEARLKDVLVKFDRVEDELIYGIRITD